MTEKPLPSKSHDYAIVVVATWSGLLNLFVIVLCAGLYSRLFLDIFESEFLTKFYHNNECANKHGNVKKCPNSDFLVFGFLC